MTYAPSHADTFYSIQEQTTTSQEPTMLSRNETVTQMIGEIRGMVYNFARKFNLEFDDCLQHASLFMLESVRIGWNRQSLDPMRSYPERVRISSRDDANDELSCTPVSPLFLPIAIPVPWYFPCYASQDANALT